MKRTILLILTIFASFIGIYAQAGKGGKYDAREIVVISSYNPESPYTYNNINSFVTAYKNQGGKFKVSIEDMRCNGIDEANLWITKLDSLIRKHVSIEAVVLIGQEANIAYASSDVAIYKKIPAYTIMTPEYVASLPDSSGIKKITLPSGRQHGLCSIPQMFKDYNWRYASLYNYDLETEMKIIRKMFPTRNTFVAISDNSYTGLGHLRIFKTYFQKHPNYKFHIIDGRKVNMDEAILQYEKFDPEKSVGLLGNWRMGLDKTLYISNAVYAFKKANGRIPVFSLTGTGIGYWAVGGYIPTYINVGEELAARIYKEIDQNQVMKPKIYRFDNHYQFDQLMLDEYRIPEELLPANSEVVNRTFTLNDFFQQYKVAISMALIILLLIIAICIAISIYSIHIRKIKKLLEESQNKLYHEKEELTKSTIKLEAAVKEAKEANNMKDNFVANISHEVRTPLNAITGFADIISDQTQDENCKEYASIIRTNTDALLKLINDVLDISNIESNKEEFEFHEYDLVPYFDSIVNNYNTRKEKVKIYFSCAEKSIFFKTDIGKIQQVLMNLISNSLKFTDEGQIELALFRETDGIQFTLTDSGIGIPKEKCEVIFERFVKLDSFKQGTGLGLSLCRMIVEILGGEIHVDSTYNKGARFVVTIKNKL